MAPHTLSVVPNPDLVVGAGGRTRWNTAEHRRWGWGWHNLHRITRYGLMLRAPGVALLERDIDLRIADLPAVGRLTAMDCFSGMAVVRDFRLLFERYAADFGPDRPHSIQSITKTMLNLMVGRLVEDGRLDLASTVGEHLPEIGSGYAAATLRDVLDMNVANSYTEDYGDPAATVFDQEVAMGWRLPGPGQDEITARDFIRAIESDDLVNRSGAALYKSSNTDVLEWIVERVGGRSLLDHLIAIVEAAGIEDVLYMATDREGVPVLNGGASMTARDLARYGQIFVRGGVGINGEAVGSRSFIDEARHNPGPAMPAPRDWMSYGRHLQTNGRWVGHGGYGGQFMLADPESRVSVAFFSVLENESAADMAYQGEVIRMCQEIAELPFADQAAG